jgi:hypothetical protein
MSTAQQEFHSLMPPYVHMLTEVQRKVHNSDSLLGRLDRLEAMFHGGWVGVHGGLGGLQSPLRALEGPVYGICHNSYQSCFILLLQSTSFTQSECLSCSELMLLFCILICLLFPLPGMAEQLEKLLRNAGINVGKGLGGPIVTGAHTGGEAGMAAVAGIQGTGAGGMGMPNALMMMPPPPGIDPAAWQQYLQTMAAMGGQGMGGADGMNAMFPGMMAAGMMGPGGMMGGSIFGGMGGMLLDPTTGAPMNPQEQLNLLQVSDIAVLLVIITCCLPAQLLLVHEVSIPSSEPASHHPLVDMTKSQLNFTHLVWYTSHGTSAACHHRIQLCSSSLLTSLLTLAIS